MSPTVTVFLLFVFLRGESFAGYSTGFRRTPKPNNPEIPPKPVAYPSPHPAREDPLWVGQGGISAEKGKNDGDISTKVGDGGVIADRGVDDIGVPKENTKGIGSHSESGHLVPSPVEPPAEEKEVPYGLPELPQEEQPSKPGEDGSIDLPGKPHPDVPKTHEDGKVPEIPDRGSYEIHPGSHPDKPFKEDKPDVPNAGADYDYSGPSDLPEKGEEPIFDSFPPSNDPPVDTVVIPPGVKTDTKNPNLDEKVPDIPIVPSGGADEDYEGPGGKVPDLPVVVPSGGTDEDIPIVPSGGADEDYEGPGGKVPDLPVVVPSGGTDEYYEVPGEKDPPVIDEEGAVGVGPLPDQDVPPGDSVVIPPGDRIEIIEPYPVRVGNGNINLYELMEKLELSRFLHLVEEADLKDLLTGEGPLTIFAPSDYALSKLDATTIRTLATNQELLRQFVLYHLVDGQIYGSSFDERDNSAMITKFDVSIHINRYGTRWYVNGIPITTRDQICKNGVIHILDSSLYPFPSGDLLETLDKMGNFKIYTELIRNAKLDRELKGNAAYTIFAPTDEAFSKLPPANLEWLKWDIPAIKRMFRQLTVNGMYYTPWIPRGNGQLTSIDEQTKLSLSGYPDSVSINGVRLDQYDITATNGCIHTIDDIWFLSELGTPSSGSSKKRD